MTHYAITQVHLDNGQITRVRLHAVENIDQFVLDEGVDTDAGDVATLLMAGHRVHVAKENGGQGVYLKADEVILKQGSTYLISVSFADRPAMLALKELPHY